MANSCDRGSGDRVHRSVGRRPTSAIGGPWCCSRARACGGVCRGCIGWSSGRVRRVSRRPGGVLRVAGRRRRAVLPRARWVGYVAWRGGRAMRGVRQCSGGDSAAPWVRRRADVSYGTTRAMLHASQPSSWLGAVWCPSARRATYSCRGSRYLADGSRWSCRTKRHRGARAASASVLRFPTPQELKSIERYNKAGQELVPKRDRPTLVGVCMDAAHPSWAVFTCCLRRRGARASLFIALAASGAPFTPRVVESPRGTASSTRWSARCLRPRRRVQPRLGRRTADNVPSTEGDKNPCAREAVVGQRTPAG